MYYFNLFSFLIANSKYFISKLTESKFEGVKFEWQWLNVYRSVKNLMSVYGFGNVKVEISYAYSPFVYRYEVYL